MLFGDQREAHIEGQHNQGGSDESFGPLVQTWGKRQAAKDHGAAQESDGHGMSQRIQQAQAHGARSSGFHAGNVRDGGNVIVVKPVTQPQSGSGGQSDSESYLHQLISQ